MAVETTTIAVPRTSIWNDPRGRAIIYQLMVVGGILLVGAYLVSNTMENLRNQQIASGFGFLDREAGFEISESLIPFSAASTYGSAFLVGILNTFKGLSQVN